MYQLLNLYIDHAGHARDVKRYFLLSQWQHFNLSISVYPYLAGPDLPLYSQHAMYKLITQITPTWNSGHERTLWSV